MKKLLTIAALVGFTAWSYGQGQVSFANTAATLVSTNAVHGGPATGPTATTLDGYVFALFAANSTVNGVSGALDNNWTFTGAYATNRVNAGAMQGGQPILPAPYASGSTFNFIVRGWSTSIAGQDWSAVQAFEAAMEAGGAGVQGQQYGTSGIATIVVGGGANPVAPLFGVNPGTSIQGFTLNQVPVPEPGTFALAGLGAAALLIFRRRKQ